MGYYTEYKLSIIEGDKRAIDDLLNENESASYALNEDGSTNEPCKWYSATNDLIKFSTNYPDTLFKFETIGEEHDDMWVIYIKNGKSQRCQAIITFEDYDENKLT